MAGVEKERDTATLFIAADASTRKMAHPSQTDQSSGYSRHNYGSFMSTTEARDALRDSVNVLEDPTIIERQETTDLTSLVRNRVAHAPCHKTTNCQTMMHLLKGNLGTGILAMPRAFSNAGILVGTMGLLFLGIVCIHCMHLLVNCSKVLSQKVGRESLDYPSVAEQAFKHAMPSSPRVSRIARTAVNAFLILTQFGFCCVYFVFVADTIKDVYEGFAHSDRLLVSYCLAMILPPMIVFNFIRNLDQLSKVSTVANLLQGVGLCFIFYLLLKDGLNFEPRPLAESLPRLPLYFGTAIYSFEGIGVVLPLENEMETPWDFNGLSGVLNTGMVIVACLFTAMGFFGYMRYGDESKGSITLNFPSTPFNESVRIMFALSIFLTYPLQLYVVIQIMWPWIMKKFNLQESESPIKVRAIDYVMRTLLVILTFALASLIPYLDLFISLVGALASSFLAMIFPPLIHIATHSGSGMPSLRTITVVKNVAIVVLGLFGFVIGSYTSVYEIVKAFRNSAHGQSS